jgi:hypothetical protein
MTPLSDRVEHAVNRENFSMLVLNCDAGGVGGFYIRFYVMGILLNF